MHLVHEHRCTFALRWGIAPGARQLPRETQYIGHVSLDDLYDARFNQVLFALPADVVRALSGGATSCRFGFGLSYNTALGEARLDRGGFAR